jgi:signal transduction histidine kinase
MVHTVALALDFTRSEMELMNARLTEQRLALENVALERTNRLEKDLMATISHETRTPLAVLTGYAELIAMELKRKGVDAQAIADLDKISVETHRLSNLMERMQNMTRERHAVANGMKLDATAVIKQTAGMYAHILARKNVQLILELAADLPPVIAGADDLTQILFNLLQNAANHTPGGEIRLSAEAKDGMVAVTVTDDGDGIAPELLPRVFERGVSGGEGSGLGLSICKEIVEAYDGEIGIESKPGHFTVVRFALPIWNGGDTNA